MTRDAAAVANERHDLGAGGPHRQLGDVEQLRVIERAGDVKPRMLSVPARSGRAISMTLSRRPGRSNAGSSAFALLVMPMMISSRDFGNAQKQFGNDRNPEVAVMRIERRPAGNRVAFIQSQNRGCPNPSQRSNAASRCRKTWSSVPRSPSVNQAPTDVSTKGIEQARANTFGKSVFPRPGAECSTIPCDRSVQASVPAR